MRLVGRAGWVTSHLCVRVNCERGEEGVGGLDESHDWG